MAPNNLMKTAFVQGKYGSSNVSRNERTIRTDFIVRNMFEYLTCSNSGQSVLSSVQPIPSMNDKEEKLILELQKIADSFKVLHLAKLQELCSCLDGIYTKDSLNAFLNGISNELFCEGITWSRIVALFVFVSELTLICIAKNLTDNVADLLYKNLSSYVKEELSDWIEDHGGWEGMLSLSDEQRVDGTPNKGWAKSLLHGTVKMLGTIAQIANTSAQAFP